MSSKKEDNCYNEIKRNFSEVSGLRQLIYGK